MTHYGRTESPCFRCTERSAECPHPANSILTTLTSTPKSGRKFTKESTRKTLDTAQDTDPKESGITHFTKAKTEYLSNE